jgi:hypothetical protein
MNGFVAQHRHGFGESKRSRSEAAFRAPSAVLALFLAALHLITALHFAIVPHGFCAGLGGFVHVHAASQAGTPSASQPRASGHSSLPLALADAAACEPEHCPLGFAGHGSVVVPAGGGLVEELTLSAVEPPAWLSRQTLAQARVLLSAPKTSPPV